MYTSTKYKKKYIKKNAHNSNEEAFVLARAKSRNIKYKPNEKETEKKS